MASDPTIPPEHQTEWGWLRTIGVLFGAVYLVAGIVLILFITLASFK